MLSHEIANLADALLSEATRGRALSPTRAARIAHNLLELSRMAAAYEDRPVPLRARLPHPDKRHAKPQQPLRNVP